MHTTQKQVREAFWQAHPDYAQLRRSRKRQNDYPADVRKAWVDWIDMLAKDGQISQALAHRVTL